MYRKQGGSQMDFVESFTAGVSPTHEFLSRLSELIDFEALRTVLDEVYADGSRAGRPGYDPVMMLKILLLERWFNLSDRAVLREARDRLSFMTFLKASPSDPLPESNTLTDFRKRLEPSGTLEDIFEAINSQLAGQGILLKEGAIKVVDATLIEAQPRPGRKNKQGKAVDGDARYARRKNKTTYGYKAHVGMDARTHLIHGLTTTPANTHDSTQLEELVEDRDAELYADKAYASHDHDLLLLERQVANRILYKATRGHPLNAKQRKQNKAWSRIRAGVERKFGEMKQRHGLGRAIYRGLGAVETQIYLTAIVVNLKRALALQG